MYFLNKDPFVSPLAAWIVGHFPHWLAILGFEGHPTRSSRSCHISIAGGILRHGSAVNLLPSVSEIHD